MMNRLVRTCLRAAHGQARMKGVWERGRNAPGFPIRQKSRMSPFPSRFTDLITLVAVGCNRGLGLAGWLQIISEPDFLVI